MCGSPSDVSELQKRLKAGVLCRKEGGTKVVLGGVCAGARDPWPATMQPDMGRVVCGGNFMSTLELVPSVNATRLLRTVYGINTPLEMNACLPGCVWNAAPRSLSPLERNIGFWTQA